jgi:hypothetical protein
MKREGNFMSVGIFWRVMWVGWDDFGWNLEILGKKSVKFVVLEDTLPFW